MSNVHHILRFIKLLNDFQKIKRVVYVHDEDRQENDIEHSYRLAMLAWYIMESDQLDLDRDLVIRYALVHDFVEVYAGDTYIYSTDQKLLKSKKEREHKAALQLQKEFPELQELHELIEQYELREGRESKFVYALDKIEPMLGIYIDNGRMWKLHGITLAMLIEHKKEKVAVSSEIKRYFDEFVTLLKKEERTLFPQIKTRHD